MGIIFNIKTESEICELMCSNKPPKGVINMSKYNGYKRTNLKTYELGKYHRVHEKDGKLYYRADNHWLATDRSYCEEITEYDYKFKRV